MKPRPKRTISIYDSRIQAGTDVEDYKLFEQGKEGDWETYRLILQLLRSMGYVLHEDPSLRRLGHKRYDRHAGSKDDVHFHSEISPIGLSFEFYEDVVRDNKHGGRYHFDKMAKMPYLRRLKVTLAHRKIQALLESRGFVLVTLPEPDLALEAIARRQAETRETHPALKPEYDYNAKDADGVVLKEGDTRCLWSRNGRLMRGTVHYNLNMMWWFAYSPTEWTNEACWRYFTYDPKKHGRKLSLDPLVKISAALRRAVVARDFKRAGRIQEALDRMVKREDFKPGDRVEVDNPRYQGPGIVDTVRPPFFVSVRVGKNGDGNTWSYEWATVKHAAGELAEVAR